ncbi:hypothetical protein CDAR_478641 [Caerostris darwini]|uniref:Uncharacterized protein n=1 Tax=Caerostris darwini TaxID=1538125 RepID=A0AAV4QQC4_9ARAC|nr:hypothetical protein CDAR_478641 [Caerostris darwini]
MLKGQLEESRNFNREILTDNLKAITEAINTTKQVQPAPTKSFAEAVKKQQTTVILAPKDKDQSVKDMRSNISKQLKKSGELDGIYPNRSEGAESPQLSQMPVPEATIKLRSPANWQRVQSHISLPRIASL